MKDKNVLLKNEFVLLNTAVWITDIKPRDVTLVSDSTLTYGVTPPLTDHTEYLVNFFY